MRKLLSLLCLLILPTACSADPDAPTAENSPPSFSAVIGQEVNVYAADSQPFQQPLSLSLTDQYDKKFPLTPTLTNTILSFRVPPQAATGMATVEVISEGGEPRLGTLLVRRLGVIANRGGGNLLLFDLDDPQAAVSFSLEDFGGFPEDVSISPDGRFANLVMAGNPSALSVEIALPEPRIASGLLPTDKASSALAVFPESFLALTANFGDEADPGNSVDLFTMQNEGIFDDKITAIPVGSAPGSRPFDLSTHAGQNVFALVSNRQEASLTKITLDGCLNLPTPNCPILQTFTAGAIQEPTGVAVTPPGDRALVADYAQNLIHEISIDTNGMALSGSLPLIGGDEGPVALRITPGGGKALVLNETSASLALLDLTQGFPLPLVSLPLLGLNPGKFCLSHQGTRAWVTFSGSHEVRQVSLNLFTPEVSEPLPVPGLNNPRGIAIQP